MPGKNVLTIAGRLLGGLAVMFALAGTAFAQQPPLRIGFGMSLTGPLAV